MEKQALKTLSVLLGLLCATATLQAQEKKPLLSGEKVYQQICFACHATGVAQAPKVGDATAWKPLIAEGQATLTGHAWVGVRGMPAQGGAPKLSLEEFARAVAWMTRQSGGTWNDPDGETLKAIRKEARERLQKDFAVRKKVLDEPSR
jgi:cytochrome c5